MRVKFVSLYCTMTGGGLYAVSEKTLIYFVLGGDKEWFTNSVLSLLGTKTVYKMIDYGFF